MKTLLTLATLTLIGATLVGCTTTSRAKSTMPINSESLNALRSEFMQADPGVKVGAVEAVLANESYLTVGNVNPFDFPVGASIAIVDSNRQTVGFGTVVRTFETSVHVSYEKAGMRSPHVGDAAVKFSEKFLSTPLSTRPLILASRSPRRMELLTAAGYAFEVEPADINEEDVPPFFAPADLAGFLAVAKAGVIAARFPDAVILAADTIVAVGALTYGKADTPEAARTMLQALAGARQEVFTGVAVISPNHEPLTAVGRSVVEMRAMTDEELDAYIASEQWRGKAGAYGIQDHDPENDPFVKLVEGEMTNVVGLPMPLVKQMLEAASVETT